MEKENIIPLKRFAFAIGIFIILLIVSLYTPLARPLVTTEYTHPVIAYFFGIALILIVIGFYSILFFLHVRWKICIDHVHLMEEKEVENRHKEEAQKLLNEDADKRRVFDRERNQVNDIFRLIELAKEKPEEIIDKTKTKEKGEVPKLIVNDKTTNKNEGVNTEKLDKLIIHYQSIISNPQNKKP